MRPKLRQQIKQLPRRPGVYLFYQGRQIIYIGKAASLYDRLRSYWQKTALASRGPRIEAMVAVATGVETFPTDSLLEAWLWEARLIKKYQPKYNVLAKDDKSFWSLVITDEEFPRVLAVRQTELAAGPDKPGNFFGPFPQAGEFKTALKILRKIFPWRDRCAPGRPGDRPCLAAEIGLCPGVCTGRINAKEYRRRLRHLALFLAGKKSRVLAEMERAMGQAARRRRFEEAAGWQRRLAALRQIQDIALLKNAPLDPLPGRLEAYDVAHLAGGAAVGVMVVSENGQLAPAEYRRFRLRQPASRRADDLAALRELLGRRLRHREWPRPELILVDGGRAQLALARQVVQAAGFKLAVASVLKDKRHQPRQILGAAGGLQRRQPLLELNQTAHRFALHYHRRLRQRML